MKAARTLTTVAASAALLCALPTPSEAMEKVDTRNLNTAEDDVSRELMEVVSQSRIIILCSLRSLHGACRFDSLAASLRNITNA